MDFEGLEILDTQQLFWEHSLGSGVKRFDSTSKLENLSTEAQVECIEFRVEYQVLSQVH